MPGISKPNGGGDKVPTPELQKLRLEIDQLDQDLIAVLAKRFAVVDRVIVEKQRHGIAATLQDRVEQVAANARRLAETTNVPPDTAERIWRLLIAETIRYEEAVLRPKNGG